MASPWVTVPGQVKVMLIIACDYMGILLTCAFPPGSTVNVMYYHIFLEHHLHLALHHKWPHLLQSDPTVLHDNTWSHVTKTVADPFRQWKWRYWNIHHIHWTWTHEITASSVTSSYNCSRAGSHRYNEKGHCLMHQDIFHRCGNVSVARQQTLLKAYKVLTLDNEFFNFIAVLPLIFK